MGWRGVRVRISGEVLKAANSGKRGVGVEVEAVEWIAHSWSAYHSTNLVRQFATEVDWI